MTDIQPRNYKSEICARIQKAIIHIRQQFDKTCDKVALDHLLPCCTTLTLIDVPLDEYSIRRRPWKIAAVTAEIIHTLKEFQALVYTDMAPEVLEPGLERIERYATKGWRDCNLVGDEALGFQLEIPSDIVPPAPAARRK